MSQPGTRREALEATLNCAVIDAFEREIAERGLGSEGAEPSAERLDATFAPRRRRQDGIYYTPERWADRLATALEWLPEHEEGGERPIVVDLSAGGGALLTAALRARPDLVAYGVEIHATAALGAAMELVRTRGDDRRAEDRVIVGDGLALGHLPEGRVAAVLANPPYLGEKGNRRRFKAIKRAHPHLKRWCTARLDLHYLFLHRALDLLAPGGLLVALTSAYWLRASGASALRGDLLKRAHPQLFVQHSGRRLFADAPGHDSLFMVARRRGVGAAPSGEARALRIEATQEALSEAASGSLVRAYERARPCEGGLSAKGFLIQVGPEALHATCAERARCQRLDALFGDRQGFVSGADRVTRAHLKRLGALSQARLGEGLFLFGSLDQVPGALQRFVGSLVRPVLRGEPTAGRRGL